MELLKASDLVKRFGNTNAVNRINFYIEEGRCVSLLGPNGAGKTTTLKMLSGLLAPTSGSIDFKGEKARDLRQFRSEEHTSELQSRSHIVYRLLHEKKKLLTYA